MRGSRELITILALTLGLVTLYGIFGIPRMPFSPGEPLPQLFVSALPSSSPLPTTSSPSSSFWGKESSTTLVDVEEEEEIGFSLAQLLEVCDSASEDYLCVFSEEGHYVGRGRRETYDLKAGRRYGIGIHNAITIEYEDEQDEWKVSVGAPSEELLVPGVYTGAEERSDDDGQFPWISVFHNNHICRADPGQFVISELEFSDMGDVQRLAMSFEMRCTGQTPSLFGRVCHRCRSSAWRRFPMLPRLRLGGEIRTPGVKVTLADISSACPRDRSVYWCLRSHAGDRLGLGRQMYFSEDRGRFNIRPTFRGGFGVYFQSDETWSVTVAPREGQDGEPEKLDTGLYEEARSNLHNPLRPVLSLSGLYQSCGVETGRFEITELVVNDEGKVTNVGFNFELKCGASGAALVGRICHWCKQPSE